MRLPIGSLECVFYWAVTCRHRHVSRDWLALTISPPLWGASSRPRCVIGAPRLRQQGHDEVFGASLLWLVGVHVTASGNVRTALRYGSRNRRWQLI